MKCFQTDYLHQTYFKLKENCQFAEADKAVNITVDPGTTYQTVIGFGGAFTEAAGYIYHNAAPEIRKEIIKRYFDPDEGLGYTMGRLVINSSDFALGNYCYVRENDETLKSFDISHEELYTLPMINDAMALSQKLNLMAAPWSPPAYMKTNNSMNGGGRLKPECYGLWADYLIRYLDEMEKKKIHIEYLSIQNEPEASQVWDSCLYTPEEMAAFVKVLAPKISSSSHKGLKLVVLDHNRDILVKWAKAFAKDEEALNNIWGFGIHWYVSEAFGELKVALDICPDKHLIFTEGCIEGGTRPGSVSTGERYARNIIGDFSAGCEGFIDWNLCLNGSGGPNHVGNLCDAPLLVEKGQLIVNSSYYYIGHFSRYVKPGAVRIASGSDDSGLQHIAFRNPDGNLIIILCNPSDEEKAVRLHIRAKTQEGIIKGHTIETWCFENE